MSNIDLGCAKTMLEGWHSLKNDSRSSETVRMDNPPMPPNAPNTPEPISPMARALRRLLDPQPKKKE
jgi:hypothetical protein